mmetsp:Transcript_35079/g.105787  ORF Transcript_35079/g.105787 Transcript_35079/m.105787 type:complete len:489 (+) Transcript_35079:79-1545(+)
MGERESAQCYGHSVGCARNGRDVIDGGVDRHGDGEGGAGKSRRRCAHHDGLRGEGRRRVGDLHRALARLDVDLADEIPGSRGRGGVDGHLDDGTGQTVVRRPPSGLVRLLAKRIAIADPEDATWTAEHLKGDVDRGWRGMAPSVDQRRPHQRDVVPVEKHRPPRCGVRARGIQAELDRRRSASCDARVRRCHRAGGVASHRGEVARGKGCVPLEPTHPLLPGAHAKVVPIDPQLNGVARAVHVQRRGPGRRRRRWLVVLDNVHYSGVRERRSLGGRSRRLRLQPPRLIPPRSSLWEARQVDGTKAGAHRRPVDGCRFADVVAKGPDHRPRDVRQAVGEVDVGLEAVAIEGTEVRVGNVGRRLPVGWDRPDVLATLRLARAALGRNQRPLHLERSDRGDPLGVGVRDPLHVEKVGERSRPPLCPHVARHRPVGIQKLRLRPKFAIERGVLGGLVCRAIVPRVALALVAKCPHDDARVVSVLNHHLRHRI